MSHWDMAPSDAAEMAYARRMVNQLTGQIEEIELRIKESVETRNTLFHLLHEKKLEREKWL